ncbi:MAG: TetR/AcrR family transcriptional regulator [Myxococcota bacterium]
MGRPRKDAFDEATALRVLRAAEQVFGERGLRSARLEDIAGMAGISRPSLLYHFGSKDKLYARVVKRAFDEIREALGVALLPPGEDRTYDATVMAVVESLLELEQQHRPLLGVVLRSLLEPGGASYEVVVAEFSELVAAIVQFVEAHGRERLAPGVSARDAVLQLIVTYLARMSMGDLSGQLWRESVVTIEPTVRALLLR